LVKLMVFLEILLAENFRFNMFTSKDTDEILKHNKMNVKK